MDPCGSRYQYPGMCWMHEPDKKKYSIQNFGRKIVVHRHIKLPEDPYVFDDPTCGIWDPFWFLFESHIRPCSGCWDHRKHTDPMVILYVRSYDFSSKILYGIFFVRFMHPTLRSYVWRILVSWSMHGSMITIWSQIIRKKHISYWYYKSNCNLNIRKAIRYNIKIKKITKLVRPKSEKCHQPIVRIIL